MDWQRHLLSYHEQLFLHYWRHLVWYVVGFLLGRGCWVGVTMIASGLLNFRRCCAFIIWLKGKIQVGIIPICVSSEGRIMPCCTIVAWLPTSACASRQTPLCTLLDRFYDHLSSSVVSINNHFIKMGWLQPDRMWQVPPRCWQMGQIGVPSIRVHWTARCWLYIEFVWHCQSMAFYFGTIYNNTLEPFEELGLDSQRVKKLASELHVHSVNHAAKLVHTRRALSDTIINSHQETVSGQACNPPDPHWPSSFGGGVLWYLVPKWLLFLN